MFRKDTDRFPAPPGVKLAALSCQISFGTGKSYVELQRCLLELSNSTQATRAVALRACGVGVAPQASDSAHHAVIRLDFLCHSINRAVGQARSAPLSGRLSLPHYLYWFSLQPTDAKGRLWRGRRQETPRPKVRTSGDVAQLRPLTSHSEAGKTFFGASTTTFQSTGSSLSRQA
jgi:hypothetical protein